MTCGASAHARTGSGARRRGRLRGPCQRRLPNFVCSPHLPDRPPNEPSAGTPAWKCLRTTIARQECVTKSPGITWRHTANRQRPVRLEPPRPLASTRRASASPIGSRGQPSSARPISARRRGLRSQHQPGHESAMAPRTARCQRPRDGGSSSNDTPAITRGSQHTGQTRGRRLGLHEPAWTGIGSRLAPAIRCRPLVQQTTEIAQAGAKRATISRTQCGGAESARSFCCFCSPTPFPERESARRRANPAASRRRCEPRTVRRMTFAASGTPRRACLRVVLGGGGH